MSGRTKCDEARTTTTTPPSSSSLPVVYHYPSTLPFPVVLDDRMPREAYRSRRGDVKTAVHWGQRKLFLSELQLLTRYARAGVAYHIVYAGAAPGTHLALLDDLFDHVHTWELVDPGLFDTTTLTGRRNFVLRNEFFVNATAYNIVARQLCAQSLHSIAAVYTHLTQTTRNACNAVRAADDVADGDIRCRRSSSNNSHDGSGTTTPSLPRALQAKLGHEDVARATVDIPTMYEPPAALPRGLQLLVHAALERAERPVLFVSDVRSGNVALDNFEDHVAENMRAQACWATLLHAEYSMLKFRLPYTSVHTNIATSTTVTAAAAAAADKEGEDGNVQQATQTAAASRMASDGTVPYLRGDVLLPIWTRQTSTEGRLVVRRGAPVVPYKVASIEDAFFFFNARVREQVHFNHCLHTHSSNNDNNNDSATDDDAVDLDHHYDAAAEVHVLLDYLRARRRATASCANKDKTHVNDSHGDKEDGEDDDDVTDTALAHEVRQLSRRITTTLKSSFAAAIRRQEAAALRCARVRDDKECDNSNDDRYRRRHTTSAVTAQCTLHERAAAARSRAVWWSNVDEAMCCTPSGMWVTMCMPQQEQQQQQQQ